MSSTEKQAYAPSNAYYDHPPAYNLSHANSYETFHSSSMNTNKNIPDNNVIIPSMTIPHYQLRTSPGIIQCPFCLVISKTITKHRTGLLSWLVCGLGTLSTGIVFAPCFSLALCADGLGDVEHRCGACKQVVFRYDRI